MNINQLTYHFITSHIGNIYILVVCVPKFIVVYPSCILDAFEFLLRLSFKNNFIKMIELIFLKVGT